MFRCVINLDSSIDRWHSIKSQFDAFGLEVERISGVLGKALTQEETAAVLKPVEFGYVYPLQPSEIGCFLSHRKAWEAFLASGEKWGMVLEDDARLAKEFPEIFAKEDWIPEDVDCLKVGSSGLSVKVRDIRKIAGIGTIFRQVRPTPFNTACYVLSASAARDLLAMTTRFNCPVDYMLFSPWFDFVHTHKVYRLDPQLVRTVGAPSDIGLRKSKRFSRPWHLQLNPLRWWRQICISYEKRNGQPYQMKDGTFK